MRLQSLLGFFALSLLAGTAFAAPPAPLPEPGVLELLAIGGIAGLAVALYKRRK